MHLRSWSDFDRVSEGPVMGFETVPSGMGSIEGGMRGYKFDCSK